MWVEKLLNMRITSFTLLSVSMTASNQALNIEVLANVKNTSSISAALN
jgi:hypothetical protein